MPKLPTYSLHKATGQARVWLNGKSYYLGVYGSVESRIKYGELLKQHAAGAPVDPLKPTAGPKDEGPTVNVIVAAFLTHAETYYVKNGKQTAEVDCIKSAMTPLVALYGDTPAKDFGPLGLKAVRQRMIDKGGKRGPWCRNYVNKSVERIRRIFRHAVSNELVPASVLTGLESVAGLEAGRTKAKDYTARTPLPQERIDAVRALVNTRTKDLMDLALLCGARPGELISLTGSMIDQTGDIWFAELKDHKMAHKGKSRVLVFGPKAQKILKQYFVWDLNRRLFPIRRQTVSNNIKRACEVAFGMPKELRKKKLTDDQRAQAMAWRRQHAFTAHWLRHCSGTAIRRSHGLDAAQATLGHASRTTTERYAALVPEEVRQVARDRG